MTAGDDKGGMAAAETQAQDGGQLAKTPAETQTANGDDAPAGGLWGYVRDFWRTLLTAGVLIWTAIFLSFFWFSGVIDNLRPETGGVVHIESPQIYTRERLVNDRFREQAWLEDQLRELEERAAVISSYRKDSVRIAARTAPAGAAAETDTPEAQPAAGSGAELEEQLLVSADDSFNLQRNMRATIRRALIENELDDRHDLGSNSLYQFNFGAAIIAGSRTRRIAAIEMEIEPVDPLQPLDAFVEGDNARCGGLYAFECAYLFDTGVLTAPDEAEAAMAAQYARWKTLYQKWLSTENAGYKRESDDIEHLLRSPQVSARIRTLIQPFFDNLDRQAMRFIESFNSVSLKPDTFDEIECRFGRQRQGAPSIEAEILAFIRGCIAETNRVLEVVGADLSGVEAFADKTLSIDPSKLYIPPGTTRGELLWSEYFLYAFNRFNEQCAWGENLVQEIGSPGGANVAGSGAGARFRLTTEVEADLLDCISRSLIRDYGSHPLGKVERVDIRQSTQFSSDSGTRADRSHYQARQGMSSIVVTSKRSEFRARERTEYVGVAARVTANKKPNGLEKYPHDTDRLNGTCRHHDTAIEKPDGKDRVLLAGISSAYAFNRLVPKVDREIGWNLLAHMICAAHADEETSADDLFRIDAQHTLPIGLFRFIELLSGSQKTFSYSVQPSGAFNLQRRDQQVDWNLTSLFTGGRQASQIAAGGDTTESWIEKQYRIIGFGAQVDSAGDEASGLGKAKFGWYIFPAEARGVFSLPVMESANVKLSALVSLPAWWESVDIKVTTSWRDPAAPDRRVHLENVDAPTEPQELRVELPTRLEFIRNHFPYAAATQPSLYQLHLPKAALRACEEANIVLKGERLWRSTVVTLGAQKSNLIQVMPDMRGIIAHFGEVIPFAQGGAPGGNAIDTVPVTIWTSEGQKSIVDTVSITVPDRIKALMAEGKPPCGEAGGNPGK
ncbi:hypothetical protein [Oricola sp.]|uniref:hypothetical protein n=1 Tax=Oricola sp. TaxID=1979950 RepID=UPI003BADA67F